MHKTSPVSNDTAALAYRSPMDVLEIRCYRDTVVGFTSYPVCPRCRTTMDREYQAFCDRCGQSFVVSHCDGIIIRTLSSSFPAKCSSSQE